LDAGPESLFTGKTIWHHFCTFSPPEGGNMDNNKFKGNWHEFKGEVKRKWGKITDNDLLECEGDYEKFLGIVQKRYGDEKDAVQSWANDWYSEREQEDIRRRHDTISRNQV
jgi:uncharacterized protein YjbJ (UPF0337 family)